LQSATSMVGVSVARSVIASSPTWYQIDHCRLSEELLSRFVPSDCDAETEAFLSQVASCRAGKVRSLLHRLLGTVLSEFDTSGLLGTHGMHLLSEANAERLLGRPRGGRLLDVGAGSGDVTARLRPLFEQVVVTEVSARMISRLRRAGYLVHACDVAATDVPGGQYDVIALLNILDRTSRPRGLLGQCLRMLAEGGKLLLSMPLPYSPCVYRGARTEEPEELLPIHAASWEFGVERLVSQVLLPHRLVVERWTRLPYLSVGDAFCPLYVLDAVVMVCGCAKDAGRRDE
jgi:SAM-dependent methyltransferase